MSISSFTGSTWLALLLDGVTFTGAHLPFFFNHMFSITSRVHGTNFSGNSIRTQRGRSGGGAALALSRDSWVTGVSLGPWSTQWLLCTCQSSRDTDGLLGCWGARTERQARWEVLDHRADTHQQVTPTHCLGKNNLYNNKWGKATGCCNTTLKCVRTD